MLKKPFLSLITAGVAFVASAVANPVDYVNTLMGTQSKFALSNGNTTPTVCVPWGMNEWIPQTGRMGDGWSYTYDADKIRGFKQTHRPSPWINDFGQFSIMPETGGLKINEDKRASWFSHKAEVAKPHYYSVYLAIGINHSIPILCISLIEFVKTKSKTCVIDKYIYLTPA